MFGTMFDPEWLEGYRKALKTLLESNPAFKNNDCWFLLCALDDIAEGRVQNLQFDYVDEDEEQ